MKIVCSKDELISGVNIVSKAVATNTTMSLLECILVQAGNGEIRLTANDMELGIETVIDGQIEVAGMVAIESKMFADVIRKSPEEEITIESDESLNVHIISGSMNFQLVGRSGDEFTFLPQIEKAETILISAFTFREIVRQTYFSIGNSDINKVMAGIDFIIKNDQLRVTTLDGHRVSIRKVQLNNIYSEQEVIIPGKALSEISKILPSDTEKEVSICFSEAHALFEFDRTVVVSRLIDGNYINVDRMMSSNYDTKVTISKRQLMDCVDRSTLLSKEGSKKPIVLDIKDEELELRVNSPMGKMNERIAIEKQGKDLIIGFNPKFILEALRAIDDERVDMYLVNPHSPLYIKDENEKYIYMILPINLS